MTSEQSASVGPAVESEIFHLFLKLLFSGSAMQKGHFAPICARSLTVQHTGSLLQWPKNLIYNGGPPADLLINHILQHHWCRLEAITAVRFTQSTKINLKIFLEQVRLSRLFKLFDHKQTNPYAIWSSYSVNQAQQSSNGLAAYSYFVPSKGVDPWRDIFRL